MVFVFQEVLNNYYNNCFLTNINFSNICFICSFHELKGLLHDSFKISQGGYKSVG